MPDPKAADKKANANANTPAEEKPADAETPAAEPAKGAEAQAGPTPETSRPPAAEVKPVESASGDPNELPPFRPPGPRSLDGRLKPEEAEARETAEQIQREKVAAPERYTVNHELVGPWHKGRVLFAGEIHEHLSGRAHRIEDEAERNECINRLVSLGAIVPYHK